VTQSVESRDRRAVSVGTKVGSSTRSFKQAGHGRARASCAVGLAARL